MDDDELRRRARITTYTMVNGVELRRPAFPWARLTVTLHGVGETAAKLNSSMRTFMQTLDPPLGPYTHLVTWDQPAPTRRHRLWVRLLGLIRR